MGCCVNKLALPRNEKRNIYKDNVITLLEIRIELFQLWAAARLSLSVEHNNTSLHPRASNCVPAEWVPEENTLLCVFLRADSICTQIVEKASGFDDYCLPTQALSPGGGCFLRTGNGTGRTIIFLVEWNVLLLLSSSRAHGLKRP